MKNFTLFIILLIGSINGQAQSITYTINSGPSFKAYSGSPMHAGSGWTTLSFNDTLWANAFNGSGSDGSGACLTPNSTIWGAGDTCIWSNATSISPDTVCFRKVIKMKNCGHVTAAHISVNGDDFAAAYINGNLLGVQPTSNNGVVYTLTPTQLNWFTHRENIFAFEAMNTAPHCGQFGAAGTITLDTTGCAAAAISELNEQDIVIMPNPTTALVRLSLPDINTIHTIKLFDIQGNLLKVYPLTTTLDLSVQPTGTYIIQIGTIDGSTFRKKIIKQ